MERLVAATEKTDANLKEMMARLMAKLAAHHERMMVRMDSQPEKMGACIEKTEATNLEANSEKLETESGQQEVPE
jgi:tRNA G26 N,N-dimethylase Trm1